MEAYRYKVLAVLDSANNATWLKNSTGTSWLEFADVTGSLVQKLVETAAGLTNYASTTITSCSTVQ